MSKHTTLDIRWHKEKHVDTEGILRHPADANAWKEIDKKHNWFAQDPRNVRLRLASDGFNPFGNMNNAYRPQSPGKDIDVFLQPLVDELKELWHVGVETYDVLSRQNFQLQVVVMWTINDFPAYGDLSGWSTKGYMACPVCNEDTSSRKLRSKICYMGHRRFLPMNHPWRRSRKHDGDAEHRKSPTMHKGNAIVQQLQYVRDIKFRKNILIPIGIRAYLLKNVCTPLIELSNFFQEICAKILNVQDLEKLEEEIVLILYKLEKKFPLAFFDVMVHLVVHLPYEAKLVRPVGYSWMYPIARHIWDVPEIEEEVEEQEEIVETTILEIEVEDLEDHQFHREDIEAQTLDPDVVFSNQNDDIDDIDDVNEDETLINYNNDDSDIDV
ncbi:hypothetical protein Ddye_014794 [Dipteronia dyeriana]|uniref:DUF4218 domain-containing protein n=1 Tax=Dipteronia dyeriana TaxID=168575 RepID=A0AAD9U4J5_9ROSI|nr:hypothetical protein Ddye_014794 [Dipteronia dyeriana]